jgi:purine-binding chemotaxis protein CheW
MTAQGETTPSTTADSGQILTFALGDEAYGMDILRVREIRGWQPVTVIPEAPPHVMGVLNLRGSIVPVIDLRARMGMRSVEHTSMTVVIVVATETSRGRHEVGLRVDSVSDVVRIDASTVQPVPAVSTDSRADYLRGISTAGDSMVMILDIDRFIEGAGETAHLQSAHA